MRGRAFAPLLFVTLVLTGGCHSGGRPSSLPAPISTRATEPGPSGSARGTIDVDDQESSGTSFVIGTVSIDGSPNGGWVTVHRDDKGRPGTIVASAHIPPGLSRHVTVPFPTRQTSGRYWAILHVDASTPNRFDPKSDVPVVSGTDVVMQQATLVVK